MTQSHSNYIFFNQYGGGESSPILIENQVGAFKDIIQKNGLLFKKINFLPKEESKKDLIELLANYNLFNLTELESIIVSKTAQYRYESEKGKTYTVNNVIINNLSYGLAKSNQIPSEIPRYNQNKVIRIALEIKDITDSNNQPLLDNEGNKIKIISRIVLRQTTNKIIVSRLLDLKKIEDEKKPGLFTTVFDKVDLEKKIVPKDVLDKCKEIGIISDLIKLTNLWGILQNLPPGTPKPSNKNSQKNRILSELKTLQLSILSKIEKRATPTTSSTTPTPGLSTTTSSTTIKPASSPKITSYRPSTKSSPSSQTSFDGSSAFAQAKQVPQSLPSTAAMAAALNEAKKGLKKNPPKKNAKPAAPTAPVAPSAQTQQTSQQSSSSMTTMAGLAAILGAIGQSPSRQPSGSSGSSSSGSSFLNGPKKITNGIFGAVAGVGSFLSTPFKAVGESAKNWLRRRQEEKEITHRLKLEQIAKGEITEDNKKAIRSSVFRPKSFFQLADQSAAELKTKQQKLNSIKQQYESKIQERDATLVEYQDAVSQNAPVDVKQRLYNKIKKCEDDLATIDKELSQQELIVRKQIDIALKNQTDALKKQAAYPVEFKAYKPALTDDDFKIPVIKREPSKLPANAYKVSDNIQQFSQSELDSLKPTLVRPFRGEPYEINTEFKDADQAGKAFKPALENIIKLEEEYKKIEKERDEAIATHNKEMTDGTITPQTLDKALQVIDDAIKTKEKLMKEQIKKIEDATENKDININGNKYSYEQLRTNALETQSKALLKQSEDSIKYRAYKPLLTKEELAPRPKIEFKEGAKILQKINPQIPQQILEKLQKEKESITSKEAGLSSFETQLRRLLQQLKDPSTQKEKGALKIEITKLCDSFNVEYHKLLKFYSAFELQIGELKSQGRTIQNEFIIHKYQIPADIIALLKSRGIELPATSQEPVSGQQAAVQQQLSSHKEVAVVVQQVRADLEPLEELLRNFKTLREELVRARAAALAAQVAQKKGKPPQGGGGSLRKNNIFNSIYPKVNTPYNFVNNLKLSLTNAFKSTHNTNHHYQFGGANGNGTTSTGATGVAPVDVVPQPTTEVVGAPENIGSIINRMTEIEAEINSLTLHIQSTMEKTKLHVNTASTIVSPSFVVPENKAAVEAKVSASVQQLTTDDRIVISETKTETKKLLQLQEEFNTLKINLDKLNVNHQEKPVVDYIKTRLTSINGKLQQFPINEPLTPEAIANIKSNYKNFNEDQTYINDLTDEQKTGEGVVALLTPITAFFNKFKEEKPANKEANISLITEIEGKIKEESGKLKPLDTLNNATIKKLTGSNTKTFINAVEQRYTPETNTENRILPRIKTIKDFLEALKEKVAPIPQEPKEQGEITLEQIQSNSAALNTFTNELRQVKSITKPEDIPADFNINNKEKEFKGITDKYKEGSFSSLANNNPIKIKANDLQLQTKIRTIKQLIEVLKIKFDNITISPLKISNSVSITNTNDDTTIQTIINNIFEEEKPLLQTTIKEKETALVALENKYSQEDIASLANNSIRNNASALQNKIKNMKVLLGKLKDKLASSEAAPAPEAAEAAEATEAAEAAEGSTTQAAEAKTPEAVAAAEAPATPEAVEAEAPAAEPAAEAEAPAVAEAEVASPAEAATEVATGTLPAATVAAEPAEEQQTLQLDQAAGNQPAPEPEPV